MSFILDALKKSENERQRNIGPSLADVPIRRPRSDRPWWAVAVAVLLIVNLGVLVAVLVRDGSKPTATPAPATPVSTAPIQSAAAPIAPAPIRPATVSSPAVRSLADEADPATSELDAFGDESPYDRALMGAAAVPDRPPVVRRITPPNTTPLPSEGTFASRSRSERTPDEMLPTHGSLIAGGMNLPDLRLDIHVYSAHPTERFVLVNMRKYVEGQRLSEGPMLERVTSEGAILNQNGTRFLLPRQ